jgi:hypothetical protein
MRLYDASRISFGIRRWGLSSDARVVCELDA